MLHAKTEIMEDGTLNGAMSQEEADCIVEIPLFLDNFALYLLTLDINTTVSTWAHLGNRSAA